MKDREEESKRLEEKNKDVEEKSRDVEDEETGQVISLEEDGRKQQGSKLRYVKRNVMRIGQIIELGMFKDCTEDFTEETGLQREMYCTVYWTKNWTGESTESCTDD